MNRPGNYICDLSKYIFIFCATIILWIPSSYSYILPSMLYSVARYVQYLMALTLVGVVIVGRKYNKIFILNILLSALLLLSTVLYAGNVSKCLNYIAPMLGTVSLISYYIGIDRPRELFRAMRHVILLYILINITTYFLFPGGLYRANLITWNIGKPNTFLGNRNVYKYYGLLLMFVTYIENYAIGEKKDNRNRGMIVAIMLSLFMEILGESLTGVIVIGLIAAYYFLGQKLLKIRHIDPRIFFYMAVGAFVVLTVFVTAGEFTNYLTLIFRGNVTFSNRVRIWSAAEKLVMSHPFLGIGTQTNEYIFGFLRNVHAHNQYLEIALRGGLVSLSVYVLIIWTAIKKLSLYREHEMTTFAAVCIFAAMIINMVECETYSYAILSYFTAIVYCWKYPVILKKYKKYTVKQKTGGNKQ